MKKLSLIAVFSFILTSIYSFGQGEWIEETIDPDTGLRTGKIQVQFEGIYEIKPNVDLRGLQLGGLNLSRANLQGANLSDGVNLGRGNLSEANLRGAKFGDSRFARVDFTGADLTGADFYQANLQEANFSGAILNEANLFGADLIKANLRGANLRGAVLKSAQSESADYREADLTNANFSGANLNNADFTGSNQTNTNFFNVVDITLVIGILDPKDARIAELEAQLAAVTAERDALPTADQSDLIAELEARPTQEAYDAVVAERDSKIEIINQLQETVGANNSTIAELEKRPTAEQLSTAIAERDARPTQEAYDAVVAELDSKIEIINQLQETVEANVSDLTWTMTGGEVTITDCDTSASGTLVIPDTIEGNPVTSIASGTFSGCSSLTSIAIPDSVTTIGRNAFFGCSSLTNITLGEGITSIGQSTFANCTSLTNITIPDGVTSIGRSAFTVCTSLTEITFPDSVTSLGDFVFYRCLSLASITFRGAAPSVEENTFKSARAGGVVLVSDGFLTSFGEIGANWNGLIIDVNRLEQLTWTTTDGEVTITDCDTSASGTLVIPDTIEGNPVTGIGRAAFEDCKSLTSITIPDSVTSIGDYAFTSCSSLTSITFQGAAPTVGIEAFLGLPDEAVIRVPSENLKSYQWNGLTVSTADQSDAIAELEARPTQEAFDAVVAERDSKIEIINQLQVTVEANNSTIAELEKRPTAEQLSTAIAERDARLTADELQDARNGSVVINSSNGEATLSFNIEESEDLKTWQATGEKITKTIQLKDGKKFYRFALDK